MDLTVLMHLLISVKGRLCGLVVRVLGYRSRGPGSIPGATRFSIWNKEELSDQCKESITVPVHKKGDKLTVIISNGGSSSSSSSSSSMRRTMHIGYWWKARAKA
jgi:hypothetical protein